LLPTAVRLDRRDSHTYEQPKEKEEIITQVKKNMTMTFKGVGSQGTRSYFIHRVQRRRACSASSKSHAVEAEPPASLSSPARAYGV
jgi:hydrogenase maturation factor HypE